MAVTKAAGRRPRDRRDRLSFLKFGEQFSNYNLHNKNLLRAGTVADRPSSARFLATCGELSRRQPRHGRDVYHATGHARGLGLLEKGDHARP